MKVFTKTGSRQHLNQNGLPVTLCQLPFLLLDKAEPVYDHRDGFDHHDDTLPACATCADEADKLQNG